MQSAENVLSLTRVQTFMTMSSYFNTPEEKAWIIMRKLKEKEERMKADIQFSFR